MEASLLFKTRWPPWYDPATSSLDLQFFFFFWSRSPATSSLDLQVFGAKSVNHARQDPPRSPPGSHAETNSVSSLFLSFQQEDGNWP